MFGLDLWHFAAVCGIALVAGFVKGAIGFALPMIMLSVMASFLDIETALALLILPVLVTNTAQAFREGWRAAWESAVKYRVHIITVLVFIAISAGFVRVLPQTVMYALLGVPIVLYAALEFSGKPLIIPVHHAKRAEFLLSVVGGLFGGISGIWGPPLIVYLMSTNVEKTEAMRVMGVSFFAGGVVLTGAHLMTGVLDRDTAPLSALLVLPALLGLWLGFWMHDRLNAVVFRQCTLLMLMLTGLNLLRRAFWA
ncbi:sulfite exporter TauE/SafE family protein [Rhodobacteraceae bacterium]|nr:sulfite exporter TauE/SafE family protein [Paracoccaceae bacterium]